MHNLHTFTLTILNRGRVNNLYIKKKKKALLARLTHKYIKHNSLQCIFFTLKLFLFCV